MTRTITWVAIAALLALGACSKKTENPPSGGAMSAGSGSSTGTASAAGSGSSTGTASAAGSGSSTGTASAAGSGTAAAAAVDVPTEMDFEGDAAEKITDKNVEARVQAIEKELEQR